jgi:hypothetical protein
MRYYIAFHIILMALGFGTPLAVYYYTVVWHPNGELAQKEEWSVLQSVEGTK